MEARQIAVQIVLAGRGGVGVGGGGGAVDVCSSSSLGQLAGGGILPTASGAAWIKSSSLISAAMASENLMGIAASYRGFQGVPAVI
jgi:hypothetical protein